MRWLLIIFLIGIIVATVPLHGQDLEVPEPEPGERFYLPFPVAIRLDGNLEDWAAIPADVVTKGTALSENPAENGSFTFALAADLQNLYIMMVMPDQNIIAGQHGIDYWNEDSLEFFVNFSGNLEASQFTDQIHQYIVSPLSLDQIGLVYGGNRSNSLPLRGVAFHTEDGWGFEAAIQLYESPVDGAEFGFQAAANGAAEQDRNVKLIWSNADTESRSWDNPGLFGRARFIQVADLDSIANSASQPSFPVVDWKALVSAGWEGYKAHYIFCGVECGNNLGLVFDPNRGYQAVSEAVGYALLMAVMMDDQSTFNTVYDAAQEYLLNEMTSLYHWQADTTGKIVGYYSAADADQDIAAALIFAQKRVERGEWEQHPRFPYGERAGTLIEVIYLFMVREDRYLVPSDEFEGEGQAITNLSYFSPAWYRLFNTFEGTDRWAQLINSGYRTLYMTQGATLGLAPDWSTSDGQPAFEFCDAHKRPREDCMYVMGFEGIRVLWRVGLDCLWFQDVRACEWARRGANFLNAVPSSQFARLYDLQGNVIIDYANEATVGMWMVTALAAEDESLQARLATEFTNYARHVLTDLYWGDTPQYYYNQSLAWFGAALFSGDFVNLYEE